MAILAIHLYHVRRAGKPGGYTGTFPSITQRAASKSSIPLNTTARKLRGGHRPGSPSCRAHSPMLVCLLNLATIGDSEPHETNRAYCSNRLFGKPMRGFPSPQGLYDPRHEHDNCGVGFICHIKGQAS